MKRKVTAEVNFENIYAYVQGYLRYWFFYSRFDFLIPSYIREQIRFRIASMRRTCYENGQCEVCGCRTTHLQMADKACAGDCYPPMIDKKTWRYLKVCSKDNIYGMVEYNTSFIVDFSKGKFIKI